MPENPDLVSNPDASLSITALTFALDRLPRRPIDLESPPTLEESFLAAYDALRDHGEPEGNALATRPIPLGPVLRGLRISGTITPWQRQGTGPLEGVDRVNLQYELVDDQGDAGLFVTPVLRARGVVVQEGDDGKREVQRLRLSDARDGSTLFESEHSERVMGDYTRVVSNGLSSGTS